MLLFSCWVSAFPLPSLAEAVEVDGAVEGELFSCSVLSSFLVSSMLTFVLVSLEGDRSLRPALVSVEEGSAASAEPVASTRSVAMVAIVFDE